MICELSVTFSDFYLNVSHLISNQRIVKELVGGRVKVGEQSRVLSDDRVDAAGARDVVDAEVLPRDREVFDGQPERLHFRRVVVLQEEDQLVWAKTLNVTREAGCCLEMKRQFLER